MFEILDILVPPPPPQLQQVVSSVEPATISDTNLEMMLLAVLAMIIIWLLSGGK